MTQILLGTTDDAVLSGLQSALVTAGYTCTTARDASELAAVLSRSPFDLIILDAHVEEVDGRQVIGAVRDAAPETSLILLSDPGAHETVVQALRYRAQDVIVRPLNTRRVLQSVRRVLLRQGVDRPSDLPREGHSGEMSPVIDVDFERRLIVWDDHSVLLTPTEAHLLKVFFENPGRVLGHAELVRLVQGYVVSPEQATGIVRPQISRLRCKLEQVPGGAHWIQSVRGIGYLYEPASHL